MVTVTLQCSVFLIVTDTLKCSDTYGHSHNAVLSVPNSHCHFELFRSLWSLSHCSVQYSSRSLSLRSVQPVIVAVTLQSSVFLMVTVNFKFQHFLFPVTLQCSVFLIVTVTWKFSSSYGHCHCSVHCS